MSDINTARRGQCRNKDEVLSWDEMFIWQAYIASLRSKDPSTQVGAVVVKNNRLLSEGYNGTPRGVADESFIWNKNKGADWIDTKYPYVIHAEANALINYHGLGADLVGATLYTTLYPCNDCAKLIIQSGINEVCYLRKPIDFSTNQIFQAAVRLFDRPDITVRQITVRKNFKMLVI